MGRKNDKGVLGEKCFVFHDIAPCVLILFLGIVMDLHICVHIPSTAFLLLIGVYELVFLSLGKASVTTSLSGTLEQSRFL